tara:strand:+ start:371 stop:901 length:531 start_codon:yes stop_codon:yes gene_type:complete
VVEAVDLVVILVVVLEHQEPLEQVLVEVVTQVILHQEVQDLELLREQMMVEKEMIRLAKVVVEEEDPVLLDLMQLLVVMVVQVVQEHYIQQQEITMPVVAAVVVVLLVVLVVVVAAVEVQKVETLDLCFVLKEAKTLEVVVEEDRLKTWDQHLILLQVMVLLVVLVLSSSHILPNK